MVEKKEVLHTVIMPCQISKKPINTTQQDYVIVLSCHKEEITKTVFYKAELFNDLLKGKQELVKDELMQRTMGVAGKLMGSLGMSKGASY